MATAGAAPRRGPGAGPAGGWGATGHDTGAGPAGQAGGGGRDSGRFSC